MKGIARLLLLAGAVGVVAAAFAPWADVDGPLSLDALGVSAEPGGQTVAGIDTPAWPVLIAIGGLVVAATVLNKLRKLVMLAGLLLVLGGAGLLYYVGNAVDIETRDDELRGLLAEQVIDVKAQPGPFLLLASGALLVVGTALARRD